jgi:hypothetical protein
MSHYGGGGGGGGGGGHYGGGSRGYGGGGKLRPFINIRISTNVCGNDYFLFSLGCRSL